MTKTDFLKKQFGLVNLPDLTYKQYFTFEELHTLLEDYEKAINYTRCCEEVCVKYDKSTQIKLLIKLAEDLAKENK